MQLSEVQDCGVDTDMPQIFLFGQPAIYFRTVSISIIGSALYLSLWITNYAPTSNNTLHSSSWLVLSLLPGVLSLFIYIYVFKCAGLIKAVVEFDHECIAETIEHMEDSKNLLKFVHKECLHYLKDKNNPDIELQALFNDIDSNNSGKDFDLIS